MFMLFIDIKLNFILKIFIKVIKWRYQIHYYN